MLDLVKAGRFVVTPWVLAMGLALWGCADAGSSGSSDTAGQVDAAAVDAATGDGVTTPCQSNEDCAGLTESPCQAAVCNGATGQCVIGNLPDGSPCASDPCMANESCSAGVCTGGGPSPADCGAKECGVDDCGASCGTCPMGAPCREDGTCDMEGLPSCDELQYEGCCSSDGMLYWCENGFLEDIDCAGAGVTCGWDEAAAGGVGFYDCGQDELADPAGAFPYMCPWDECPDDPCAGRECGSACDTDCGTCGDGQFCSAEGLCEGCSCDGKDCGDDGCGNDCGACSAQESCEVNTCVADPCEGISFQGCCDGNTLKYCDDGSLASGDCQDSCGWDPEGFDGYGWYDCGAIGEDPSGENPIDCSAGQVDPVDQGPDEDPEPDPEFVDQDVFDWDAIPSDLMDETGPDDVWYDGWDGVDNQDAPPPSDVGNEDAPPPSDVGNEDAPPPSDVGSEDASPSDAGGGDTAPADVGTGNGSDGND